MRFVIVGGLSSRDAPLQVTVEGDGAGTKVTFETAEVCEPCYVCGHTTEDAPTL